MPPPSCGVGSKPEVRFRRKGGKETTAFGYARQPQPRSLVRRHVRDFCPIEPDRSASRLEESVDDFQNRRLPGSVRANDDGHRLGFRLEIYSPKDLGLVVPGVDALKEEHVPRAPQDTRSEEHTSEFQSRQYLV